MKRNIGLNDYVVLIDEKNNKHIVEVTGEVQRVKKVGVIDTNILIDKKYGSSIKIGEKVFHVLEPSMQDKIQSIKRKAQIILPRDAAQILMNCSVEPGCIVLEAGIGSGALTIALASIVKPKGRVISYDVREDFIEHARENLRRARLEEYVKIEKQDVTQGIKEKELDAVILDVPNPWDAVKHAYEALKTGGYLCAYSPLISQVENTVKTIRKYPFIEVKTIENIQREMIVGERGTRPSFHMLGHTGYLTFARKILPERIF
jgi:tRNA (adenine57-N1/adenine58-N1)-methyltransferase